MAACSHPPIPKSRGKNWIERIPGAHIPQEIECLARAFYWEPGRTSGNKQESYQQAVGVAEDWAAGRRKISKEKQAKYIAAVAKWNALRAASKARTAAKNMSADCGCETIDLATPTERVRKLLAKKGHALPGGRFPIRNHSDVKKAIRAVGRARPATGEERAKVRRHIIRNAKRIKATHLIPSSWKADGSLDLSAGEFVWGALLDLSNASAALDFELVPK